MVILNGKKLDKKLELSYPCNWEYKLICTDEKLAVLAAKEILNDRKHSLDLSNTSKKGKFQSYTLKLEVQNEEDRLDIFDKLQKHKNIKMVI